jgi:hypothetical protein
MGHRHPTTALLPQVGDRVGLLLVIVFSQWMELIFHQRPLCSKAQSMARPHLHRVHINQFYKQ